MAARSVEMASLPGLPAGSREAASTIGTGGRGKSQNTRDAV